MTIGCVIIAVTALVGAGIIAYSIYLKWKYDVDILGDPMPP